MTTESKNISTQIIDLFKLLTQDVANLNDKWPLYAEEVICWKLPIHKEQKIPDIIEPIEIRGHQAIPMIQHIIKQFEFEEGQDPATAVRLPGIVKLKENEIVWDLLNKVQSTKIEIKKAMMTLPPRQRPTLVKEILPGKSLLQIYRQINFFDDNLRKMVFTWVGNTYSSKLTSKEKITERILNTWDIPPIGVDIQTWNYGLQKELNLINNISSNEQLSIRKKIAPHPRCMVFTDEITGRPSQTFFANMPLFTTNDDFELTLLRAFNKLERKAKKSNAYQWESIISRYNLYLKK